MNIVKTIYGNLQGVRRFDTYPGGAVNDLELMKANEIITPYGAFIPRYTEKSDVDQRSVKHRSSMNFHPNGVVKSIALEEKRTIDTILGEFPAELITFYEDGSLNRLFPLNGQIDGFWSEEDEGSLAESFLFQFPFGSFYAKVIGLRFYPSGALKSLTLWPKEIIAIETPIGPMTIRIGFSLYESGALKSIEPAEPVYMNTPIGYIKPYDVDPLGIHADHNSLEFTEEGDILSLKTMENGIIVTGASEEQQIFKQKEVPSYIDVSETVLTPLVISFHSDAVLINDGEIKTFNQKHHSFRVFESVLARSSCGSSCSSCSGCGH